MKSRREFLKEAATGAVLLGSSAAADKLALAGVLKQHAAAGKSKVVIARDASLHGAGTQPDEQHVLNLLDKAMAAYTGREKPMEAWKSVIPANILAGGVIGLKVNGLGGRGISTHAALTMAVAERLQQAGVKAGNIVVWDQNALFLEACGMTISTDPSRIRCYPADSAGFDDEESSWGVARIRLTKILTRDCAMVINLPILKDHQIGGRHLLHEEHVRRGGQAVPAARERLQSRRGRLELRSRCAREGVVHYRAMRSHRYTTAGRASILSGCGIPTRWSWARIAWRLTTRHGR